MIHSLGGGGLLVPHYVSLNICKAHFPHLPSNVFLIYLRGYCGLTPYPLVALFPYSWVPGSGKEGREKHSQGEVGWTRSGAGGPTPMAQAWSHCTCHPLAGNSPLPSSHDWELSAVSLNVTFSQRPSPLSPDGLA